MKIYNTLSATLEEFTPIEEGKVGMYVCGPTVYDKGHLGHGRSMVAFDVARRYLEYRGFDVNFVTNWTDIDDKMINRAAEENMSVAELAEKIIPMYERDFDALQIARPSERPAATEYIDQMISIVRDLMDKGVGYELDDGIYFDTSKFEDYGKLSKQKLDELEHGARVDIKEGKRNPTDFALWKFKKEGEPSWTDSEGVIAEGRPGWHIECSAMSGELLGATFDIHAGGVDLVFPHHECEIAQSEVHNETEFAKYWMHNGYINVDGEKMSKSLGNFTTLEDILKLVDGRVIRFALISSHYRSPINFDEDLFTQAKASIERLQNFHARLKDSSGGSGDATGLITAAVEGFESSMDNDFDTAGALGSVFTLIKEVNQLLDGNGLTDESVEACLGFLDSVNAVLQVVDTQEKAISDEALALIKEREQARADKDYVKSDELRDKLLEMGIQIEDKPDGTKWKAL